jgi:hypothetical protein
MTNPPTYDKSHPDVTNLILRYLSPGFVEYGPLKYYGTVKVYVANLGVCHIWGISQI